MLDHVTVGVSDIERSMKFYDSALRPLGITRLYAESERFAGRRISYDYYMGRATNEEAQDILLSDWQVDTSPKPRGRQIFSLDGRKPGNNHEAGGNLLSCGGAVIFSPPKAEQDVVFPSTVKLLGP